jgi:hypothetical protein
MESDRDRTRLAGLHGTDALRRETCDFWDLGPVQFLGLLSEPKVIPEISSLLSVHLEGPRFASRAH